MFSTGGSTSSSWRLPASRSSSTRCGRFHTIFRRIGWIHHNHIKGDASVHATIDCHLAVLNAVANRHVDGAMAASDGLIDFVDSMFDLMEREVDPSLSSIAVSSR